MASLKEESEIINTFKGFFVDRLKDVAEAIPAIIPQSDEDRKLFKKGLKVIDDIIYDLENAENVRDISQYINIDKVLSTFDGDESLHAMHEKIASRVHSSLAGLSRTIEGKVY